MKLLIEQSPDCKETEIRISCRSVDEKLNRIIEQIRLCALCLVVEKDGLSIPIALEEIFYFDSVDNRTFLYKEADVYPCEKKLYELEEELARTSFVRVSKNCILNTAVVASVRAQFSGRLEATLTNGEKILISRHYLNSFRDKFKW